MRPNTLHPDTKNYSGSKTLPDMPIFKKTQIVIKYGVRSTGTGTGIDKKI
jgi:hypothetical protein